jgi:arabinose-5-phosphate isomerase
MAEKFDYWKIGKTVVTDEVNSLNNLIDNLDENFNQICGVLEKCKGKIFFVGVGQSFHVAKKTACSISSLGRPAFYMHATEALHGDMGMITKNDVVVFISSSGETPEVMKIIEPIKRISPKTIAIVSKAGSSLAANCEHVLVTGVNEEAGPIKFAPSSSALVMIGLLDAITMAIATSIGFTEKDYLKYHPGGELGKKLREKNL